MPAASSSGSRSQHVPPASAANAAIDSRRALRFCSFSQASMASRATEVAGVLVRSASARSSA